MTISYHEMSRDLNTLASAISKTDNEWEFGHLGNGEPDHQYIEHLVRQAYTLTICFLEKYNSEILALQMLEDLDQFSDNLTKSEWFESIEEPRLSTTIPLWNIVNAFRQLYTPNIEEVLSPQYANTLTILRNIPLAKTHHNIYIQEEKDLDTFAETLLVPLFPELHPNPVLQLENSYRQPDTAIPNLKTLIEYKFLTDKKNRSKLIDEMQADIRNYAGKGWDNLIFLIGQTQNYFIEDKVKADILNEPSSFQNINVIVVVL